MGLKGVASIKKIFILISIYIYIFLIHLHTMDHRHYISEHALGLNLLKWIGYVATQESSLWWILGINTMPISAGQGLKVDSL